MIRALVYALIIAVLSAAPANAGPALGAAIAGIVSTVGTFLASSGLGAQLLRMAAGMLISRLLAAKVEGPESQAASGIKTDITQTGGVNSQSFILGTYATAGTHVCPPMTHDEGDDPNKRLTYVVDLGDMPQGALLRTWIGGEEAVFDGTVDANWGPQVTSAAFRGGGDPESTSDDSARAFLKYYDGTQVTADAALLAQYGTQEERPWLSDMVLTDVPHAILTFRYAREVFSGFPQMRFETEGVSFYDPRQDSAVGGSGVHRWADDLTWIHTENPAQMIYNILRGVALPDGAVWGIGAAVDDLPLGNWFAGMNVCDEDIALAGGGTEKRYRAGYEVKVGDEPLGVIGELLKSCGGGICEFGGYWHIQAGAPETPTLSITDDDIIVSDARELAPFPGLAETFNGVSATYPDRDNGYETTDAEAVYNATWEAEDGNRQLVAAVQLPAVPWATQVRRLMREMANDNRRFRTHVIALPPDALHILPLQTISWTSDHNGYTAKTFEVVRKVIDPVTLNSAFAIRERDPADYSDNAADDAIVPSPPSPGQVDATVAGVPGFGISAVTGQDAGGEDRRAGIGLSWDAEISAEGVSYQVRVAATSQSVTSGTVADVSSGGSNLFEALLPDTAYEVRARLVTGRRATWGTWLPVTTGNTRLSLDDLSGAVFDAISADATGIASTILNDFQTDIFTPAVGGLNANIEQLSAGQRSAERAADQISENVLWSLLNVQRTESLIRDAGIYVDQVDGNVRIAGIEQAEGKISEVEINLNAQAAAINLRATYAQVESIVAAAALDPSALPVFTDLQLRMSTAEIDIDGLEGALTLKADVTTVSGIDARLVTAEADIDAAGEAIALKVNTSEFTGVETRLQTAEVTISALDVPAITQSVADTRYLHNQVDLAEVSTLKGLLELYQTRQALRADLAFASQDLRALVDEDRSAIAQLSIALGASIDGNAALIQAEQQARVDADGALASDITSLQAGAGTLAGDISVNASGLSALTVRVTTAEGGITSQASDITSLSTTVGGHTTTITEHSASIDGVLAEKTIQLDNNGHISGLVLRSEMDDEEAVIASAAFIADKFAIVGPGDTPQVPFVVYSTPQEVNGIEVPAGVYMENAFIKDLSAVVGTIGTLETSSSGQRAQLSDLGTRVFYENGVVAIELGLFG